jgi:hypothetical protein
MNSAISRRFFKAVKVLLTALHGERYKSARLTGYVNSRPIFLKGFATANPTSE